MASKQRKKRWILIDIREESSDNFSNLVSNCYSFWGLGYVMALFRKGCAVSTQHSENGHFRDLYSYCAVYLRAGCTRSHTVVFFDSVQGQQKKSFHKKNITHVAT